MKGVIIKINDVSDIDVSRIGVYDLNNRYIDIKGNIYGLKFDQSLKRIKIVRIIRSRKEDAPFIQQQIFMKKLHGTPEVNAKITEQENVPDVENKRELFNPSMVVKDILGTIDSHKARLKGIMMNIKNSNLFLRENKEENKELEDIFRSIDIDGILQLEKAESYEKELTVYPRSITYYQAKVDNQARAVMEQLAGNDESMRKFIYAYEMSGSLLHVYEILRKILVSLADLIKRPDSEEESSPTPTSAVESKALADAQISITNTIIEIDGILGKLKPFSEYLKHAGNF